MGKVATVELLPSRRIKKKFDDLLVFDVRCVDVPTRQKLLRLLPQLVHLRRAWTAHFTTHGCLTCQKPDRTVTIAAKLRGRGMPWKEVYEVIGLNRGAMSLPERKRFEHAVRWKLAHPEIRDRKPSHRYGAGGLCDLCYARIRRELTRTLRKMHEGRDATGETAALTRRFDVAQWLLS